MMSKKYSCRQTMVQCKCCKTKLDKPNLFLENKLWIEIQELYKQKGIDNPEFIQLIEEQTKQMCFFCGAMDACKSAMIYTIAENLEKNVFDDAVLFHNLALNFNERAAILKAINRVEQTIIELKIDNVKAHAILFALTQINGKYQHLKEKEKEMMNILKEKGLSNQDISTIFDRSKETIYRALKEVQT